jgi:hypothetical protein
MIDYWGKAGHRIQEAGIRGGIREKVAFYRWWLDKQSEQANN